MDTSALYRERFLLGRHLTPTIRVHVSPHFSYSSELYMNLNVLFYMSLYPFRDNTVRYLNQDDDGDFLTVAWKQTLLSADGVIFNSEPSRQPLRVAFINE